MTQPRLSEQTRARIERGVAKHLQRRAHYLAENGPRKWTDAEIARWLLALCLRRDGRTDATERADEILPRPNKFIASDDLMPRERGAFACAMYLAYSGALAWPVVRVARVFNVQPTWAMEVLAATASDAAVGGAPFRAGLADLSLIVTNAVMERGRA